MNSVFERDWWLDGTAGKGNWGEIRIESGGHLQARFVYARRRYRGFTLLTSPLLTQSSGPWFRKGDGKYSTQLARQKDLVAEMVRQLPQHDLFSMGFHWSVTNGLPWHWHGYRLGCRYTYRLENLSDLPGIWERFEPKIRTDVKKATTRFGLAVVTDLGVDRFFDVNALTFRRQGLALPYSRDFVRRLDQVCAERGVRRIFFAVDQRERIHAVLYLVWDDQQAYYLMGGGDPELRASGATSLLVWQAIQFAAGVSRSFDFEGSMLEPVERFFRGFGAIQTPYLVVTKAHNRLLRTALNLRAAGRAVSGIGDDGWGSY